MTPTIKFFDLPDFAQEATDLKRWLVACSDHYQVSINELYFNFVSAETLLSLNQTHLSHDTHTDILTFSYALEPSLSAEIFISLPMLVENASLYDVSPGNELLRLISHGFLHAVGYTDLSKNEKIKMTQEENNCLSLFHVKHSDHV